MCEKIKTSFIPKLAFCPPQLCINFCVSCWCLRISSSFSNARSERHCPNWSWNSFFRFDHLLVLGNVQSFCHRLWFPAIVFLRIDAKHWQTHVRWVLRGVILSLRLTYCFFLRPPPPPQKKNLLCTAKTFNNATPDTLEAICLFGRDYSRGKKLKEKAAFKKTVMSKISNISTRYKGNLTRGRNCGFHNRVGEESCRIKKSASNPFLNCHSHVLTFAIKLLYSSRGFHMLLFSFCSLFSNWNRKKG